MTSPDTREERHTADAARDYRPEQLLEIMRTEVTRRCWAFALELDPLAEPVALPLLVVPVAEPVVPAVPLDPLPYELLPDDDASVPVISTSWPA